MVRKLEGSKVGQEWARIMDWVPRPMRGLAFSLSALAAVTLAAYPFLHALPRGSRGSPVVLIFYVLYLLVLLGSSWLGYLSGICTWTLIIFILPRVLSLNSQPRQLNLDTIIRLGLLFVVSLLISSLGASRRRREQELLEAAGELEHRVEERTIEAINAAREAQKSADSMREQAQLLDMAHDAILSLDLSGVVRFWSRGAEQMYGYSSEEALGQNSHDLLRTEFPEPLASIEDKVATAGYWEGELTHVSKAGAKLRVASRWAVRRDGGG